MNHQDKSVHNSETNPNNVEPETNTQRYNQQLAEQFLKALDTGNFTFQLFDDAEEKKLPPDTFYGSFGNLQNKLSENNAKGYGIFVTINRTKGMRRRKEDVTAIRALFIDLDKEIPQQWHLEPSIIVKTSGNKGHAYWLLDKPSTELEKFKTYQKRLIHYYKSDIVIHDLPRVMRLPGYWHLKGEPTMVSLSKCDSGVRYTLDEIVDGLEPHPDELPPTKVERRKKSLGVSSISDLIENVRNAEPNKERNVTLNRSSFAIGQRIASNDELDEDELIEQLLEAAEDAGLSQSEAISTIHSGIKAGKQNPIQVREKQNYKSVVIDLLREEYDLRWNEMSYCVEELSGKDVDVDVMEVQLAEKDILIGADTIGRLISGVAKQKNYHPVRNYLNSLDSSLAADEEFLNTFWKDLLGVESELECIIMTKTLVAAVKRVMEPGCELDFLPILHGKQGIGKTKFFCRLFSSDFFRTCVSDGGDERKELLSMYKAWCIEWGEFEYAYGKKGNSATKSFVTRCIDEFVEPYGRGSKAHKRGFILVGTTNEDEFLTDPTGDRRYWVVKVTKKVNLAEIEQMRDVIWATTLKLYKEGYSVMMTDEQEAARAQHTQQFRQDAHPWLTPITEYLQGNYCSEHGVKFNPCKTITTDLLLTHAIGKPVERRTRKDEMDVATCMKLLGYNQVRTTVDKVKSRKWVSETQVPYQPAPSDLKHKLT
ncbi:VapE domain-containing protein [Chroococcidiopsis thermalis]|uniref:Virulence-associated E family protein n=1 Tax=Chroococcidiopsis thermalis (strain PCC 7203) TaxID=251229 RepID=K9TV34_CHRTP|nr:VapE domain-containing protein [Chroococcidiopsis thermalis]AFY86707.1 virulence-associated E family protein [Chroococcidiopsis thermalis PCC 7203]